METQTPRLIVLLLISVAGLLYTVGSWAAFVAFLVHGMVDPDIYGQSFKMIWFTLAAATWRLTVGWQHRGAAQAPAATPARGPARRGG